jgi:hypothetical protein
MENAVDRRGAISLFGATTMLAAAAPAPAATRSISATVLIEQTLLKSKPNLRADLIRFIERNWFELDEAAMQAGLFTGYWLVENDAADATWDVAVCVAYPQAQGYNHPQTKAAFDKLRGNRKAELINGRKLAELGDIVGNQSFKLRTGRASIRAGS